MNEMKHYEITRDDLSQFANRGADFIKLFPASFGGPDLVKAILAPLDSSSNHPRRAGQSRHCS